MTVGRRFHTAVAAALCLLPLACAHKAPAPIEDRDGGGIARREERYVVLPGDTLFSIAFRYGLDYRRLAAANGIVAPFTIFPGQALRLVEAEPPRAVAAPSERATATDSARAPAPVPPPVVVRPAAPAATPPVTTARRGEDATPASPVPRVVPPLAPEAAVAAWQWPADGRVTRRFEPELHKGIDIAGGRGDPVVAAGGGRVVYAGSGIAGYGLMLILRHNDEYLSAYGHNDALLVGEGDLVRAGQTIARRGSTGTDSVKLHFEIRRGGRPVDPQTLLPRR